MHDIPYFYTYSRAFNYYLVHKFHKERKIVSDVPELDFFLFECNPSKIAYINELFNRV